MQILLEIVGWTGSAGVIAAYGLNSYDLIKANSWSFFLLNILGASFLAIYTYSHGAYASTVLNVIWVAIALPATLKFILKARQVQ